MAEITYPHFDQHYSKYIFRNSISHNLQRAEGNGDNIKFYWINFITSLLFLCKQFYNPKLKVIIIISSLIHLAISHNTLSVSFNSVSIIVNLKSSPTHELNFSQSKYYISPTKLLIFLQTCSSNYSTSTKWNAKAIIYTWKWHYFCQVILT